jgi:hypothetical protein
MALPVTFDTADWACPPNSITELSLTHLAPRLVYPYKPLHVVYITPFPIVNYISLLRCCTISTKKCHVLKLA